MKNSTNSQFLLVSSIKASEISKAHQVEYAHFQEYCNLFTALEVALHKFKSSISAYKSNKSKRSRLNRILMEEALGMSKILSLHDRGQFAMH